MGRYKDYMIDQLDANQSDNPALWHLSCYYKPTPQAEPARMPEDVIADYMDSKEDELWEFLTEVNRSV